MTSRSPGLLNPGSSMSSVARRRESVVLVRDEQRYAHYPEQGRHHAGDGAVRYTEHNTHQEHGLNGRIAVDAGAPWLSRGHSMPVLQGFFIDPELNGSPVDERSVILWPVEDAVGFFVCFFHTTSLEADSVLNFRSVMRQLSCYTSKRRS